MTQRKRQCLSTALRTNILEMIEAGYGYRTIAHYFHLSIYTVKDIVKIHQRGNSTYFDGSSHRKNRRYPLEYKIETVDKFLTSGLPLKTFCHREAISHATLRVWLEKMKKGELPGH